ncbi:hypothetical protein PPERSA_11714 [Pseudocohnilembus persalinus]|uniref:Transmembrane protein n=1 Tax=Pseudocohnilembus persalinus TaxID=266149 RepID=A0A0V0QG94_PSEPJ|nr:hypothetical protein PPERSA_11714 [Pseudocohnilembus persalinus]|eukprot:KRX01267.1 hypothetical protein PPERSA_11714 [Pseudocohnilembus persalinus]
MGVGTEQQSQNQEKQDKELQIVAGEHAQNYNDGQFQNQNNSQQGTQQTNVPQIPQTYQQVVPPQYQYPEKSQQLYQPQGVQIPINYQDVQPQFQQQDQNNNNNFNNVNQQQFQINYQSIQQQEPNPYFDQFQQQQQYQNPILQPQIQQPYQQPQFHQNSHNIQNIPMQIQNQNQNQQQNQNQNFAQNQNNNNQYQQQQFQQQQQLNVPVQNFPVGTQQPSFQSGVQQIPNFKEEDRAHIHKGQGSGYKDMFGSFHYILSIITLVLLVLGIMCIFTDQIQTFFIFYVIYLIEVGFSKFTKVIVGENQTPEQAKQMVQKLREQKIDIRFKLTAYIKKSYRNRRRNQVHQVIQDNIIFNYNNFVDVTNVEMIDVALEQGDPVLIKFVAFNCRKDLAAERDYNELKKKWLEFGETKGKNPKIIEINKIHTMPEYTKVSKDKSTMITFNYFLFSLIGLTFLYRCYFCNKNVMFLMHIRKAVGY